MRLIRLVLFLSIVPNLVNAECNFKSGNYVEELANPKHIQNIIITVPKSSNYVKNFLRIITVPTQNIPPELKIKFKAFITVNYSFGNCTFPGTIKQNGDWRDHIDFDDHGAPIRSLNVTLNTGNILNAVKFKLLLPETRNDLNEVLGAVLLSEMGFITPETFQVRTVVNDVETMMLFQEDAQKEMLERNNRREGPIFEGDESLLWSYKDYKTFELSELALARMVNKNWFLKGLSSEAISLKAYKALQKEYLRSNYGFDTRNIYPNEEHDKVFQEYFLVLLSMNGLHGLAGHNRRFYFNSFTNAFEPIYYDADLDLKKPFNSLDNLIEFEKYSKISKFRNKFSELKSNLDVLKNFKDRSLKSDQITENFFIQALSNLEANLDEILKLVELRAQDGENHIGKAHPALVKQYLKSQNKLSLNQIVIFELEERSGSYLAHLGNGKNHDLNSKALAQLISKNKINGERAVYLPDNKIVLNREKTDKKSSLERIGLIGHIEYSDGVRVDFSEKEKRISFTQSLPSDWVLFSDTNLQGWRIDFLGLERNHLNISTEEQRFNYRGMTGCLNFYNTEFGDTEINVVYGGCEDSLNLVNSKGKLTSITIRNAYADALDIDFSKIEITDLTVEKAWNDCFDVSGGDYTIKNGRLYSCEDKGVSVGEKSQVYFEKLNIDNAAIGISSKDLSKVYVNEANVSSVKLCYEVFQKKQEFGGANLNIDRLSCSDNFIVDDKSNSEVILN